MFIALMSWLRYEGYVRYKALVGADFFYQVVLSEKGLRALNSMPEGISEHEFFGEKISEAATDISKDTTKKILADLVGQMIGGVIKSLSSG